ncbi:hypothetical protein A9Q99_24920 [Gammaproteobacteria bacterium 45_16_T64]|nr:hypothetical protein A9Q99_24920 [Gammaproteobacteria bacterium 45_16_T64]
METSKTNDGNQTVLVTGASGFIAQHCIIELLKRGFTVRGSLRNLSKAATISQNIGKHVEGNVTFIEAELQDAESWIPAVRDCDYVLHVASPFPLTQPKNPEELTRPAVNGTLNVVKACAAEGIKRVVVTSSIASIMAGYKESDRPAVWDENYWSNLDNAMSPYERSKTMAEKALWDFMENNTSDLEAVTVCPGAVIGPVMDENISTSIQIIKKLLSGEAPACPKVGWPFVDVRDVAWMHVEAMLQADAVGKRFCAVDESIWLSDIAKILHPRYKPQGYKVPTIELPNWLVKIAANVMPDLKAVKSSLGILGTVSSERAKQELRWSPINSEQSIVDTAESLIALRIV